MFRSVTVLVRCQISLSGFSGERVFRVKAADGNEYVGAAPLHYFKTANKKPLSANVPAEKKRIDGLIEALLVGNSDDGANVVFPGGEMVRVSLDQVLGQKTEGAASVSV
jgi:hypothetical protein